MTTDTVKKEDVAKVSIRRACHNRLKVLAKAEGTSFTDFLDILVEMVSIPMPGNIELSSKTPVQQVMERLDGFDHRLASIGRDMDNIQQYLLNEEGQEKGAKC